MSASCLSIARSELTQVAALPKDTLELLLLTQDGIDIAETISREIRNHCSDETDRYECTYSHLTGLYDGRIPDTWFHDVELLGSFDGGASRAVDFMTCRFQEAAIEHYPQFVIRNHQSAIAATTTSSQFATNCKLLDESLLKILVHDILAHMRQGIPWDPHLDMSEMIQSCSKPRSVARCKAKSYGLTADIINLCRGQIFPRSSRLMAEWHSREYGEVMAQKVTGHLLPPELVEMIEECFYSKSFLTSLGV